MGFVSAIVFFLRGLRGNVAEAPLWESTRWDSRDQPRRKTHSSGIWPTQWRSRSRFW